MIKFVGRKEKTVSQSELKDNRVDKSRMKSIDVAKGIGMILVVYAHINYHHEIITTIYSFHMPLFFIISGILFYLLSILYTAIMDIIAVGIGNLSLDKYLSFFVQMFLSQGSSKSVNAPLWFVPCLFVIEILYYFISKLSVKQNVFVCALLVMLGWLLESKKLSFDNTVLPWSLDSALFSLGFFAFGNLLSGNIKNILVAINSNKYKYLICFFAFAAFIAITILFGLINGKVSLGSKVLNNGFFLYLTGISGTVAVFSISLVFEKSRLLQYIGKNSFYFMSSHYLIRNFILTCYRAFEIPKYDIHSISQTIIPAALVFALSIAFTLFYNFIKKYFLKNYYNIGAVL